MNGRHRGDGETYDDSFTWRILRLSEDSDILNSAGELILESTATPMPLIPDPYLRAKLEDKLSKNPGDPITANELAALTGLWECCSDDVENLTGLEYCTNLTSLSLFFLKISDVSPLANLTNLTSLDLDGNQISDISPLASLTSLTQLWLQGNPLMVIAGPIIQVLKDGGTTVTHDPIPDPAEANIPDANLRVKLEQALGKNADDPITDLELAGLSGQLNATGADISDLTGLEYCINLTGLILGGNQISDISPLANLTSLTQLWLKGKSIDGHY